MEQGGRSLHQEDPRRRIILEPRFLYSVYVQRVVLVPSARIFLLKWYVEASARTILVPCKLPSLGGS